MKNILIIGLGNQGKKRLKIIEKLNYNIFIYDPKIKKFSNKEVLGLKYEFVFLCCTDLYKNFYLKKIPSFNYKKILIEKPLVINRTNSANIKNLCKKKKIYVSYNHIFDDGVSAFISYLKNKKIYYLDFQYMNGTAANVRLNKWRDRGNGVIYDLFPHLIHILMKIRPNLNPKKITSAIKKKYENKSPDFANIILGQKNFTAKFDMSFVSWKNKFTLNAYSKFFSIHLNGLKKWGESSIVVYKRKYPSGIPHEKKILFKGEDLSFKTETNLFIKNKIFTQYNEIDLVSKFINSS